MTDKQQKIFDSIEDDFEYSNFKNILAEYYDTHSKSFDQYVYSKKIPVIKKMIAPMNKGFNHCLGKDIKKFITDRGSKDFRKLLKENIVIEDIEPNNYYNVTETAKILKVVRGTIYHRMDVTNEIQFVIKNNKQHILGHEILRLLDIDVKREYTNINEIVSEKLYSFNQVFKLLNLNYDKVVRRAWSESIQLHIVGSRKMMKGYDVINLYNKELDKNK